MRRILASTGIVAAVVIALTACGAGASASTPAGTWGDAGTKSEPSLVLAEDGGLGGTDGCNTLGGTWKVDGDRILFIDVMSTLMYCDDVDTWLSGLSSATISGSTMTVFDEDGAEIGKLDRTE